MSAKASRRSIAALVALGMSSACSSNTSDNGTNNTTTRHVSSTSSVATTQIANTRKFFEGEGRTLIRFEQATRELATGRAPDRPTCIRLTTIDLPKVTREPNDLIELAQRIPDPELATAFQSAVSLKLILVLGCSSGTTPPTGSAADPKAYTSIRGYSEQVQVLLAKFDIDIETAK